MIIHDNKKALATIMSSRKSHDSAGVGPGTPVKPQKSMAEGGEVDPRHIHAEAMIEAMHESNPQKLMESMAAFHDAHKNMSEEAQDTTPKVKEGPEKEE